MGKDGKTFASVYWYNDDPTTIYLAGLSVNIEVRKQGLGTLLQEIREDIGRKMAAKTACLSVNKDSWMYEWYIRRGYKSFENGINEDNNLWMKKSLV